MGQSVENDPLKPLSDDVIKTLVNNHKRFLSYLSKRVGSGEIAEDILQNSLKKVLEVKDFDATNVVAWFQTILRNSLIDYYRSKASEDKKNDQFLKQIETDGTADVKELEETVCECFYILLPTLHESYAELLERIDLRGQPIAKVADELKITENNLNVKLHRARKALKTSLELSCGTCAKHGCLNCECQKK